MSAQPIIDAAGIQQACQELLPTYEARWWREKPHSLTEEADRRRRQQSRLLTPSRLENETAGNERDRLVTR